MRILVLILALLPLPALAWEAGTDGLLCTLSHSEGGRDVLLTYDPGGPLYTITLTRPAPWPDEPVFAIRFSGGEASTISTDRHRLSPDGRSLTVADRGFGNVFLGMTSNTTLTALMRDTQEAFSLDGAAAEVAVFRACETAALS